MRHRVFFNWGFSAAMSLLVSVLCIAGVAGCKSASTQATKLPNDFSVYLERTPCYGRCATFQLTVNNKGVVDYNGIRFVDNIGRFTKSLSAQQMAELQALMQNANFFAYKDEYDDPGISDLPSVIVGYRTQGKEKKVTYRAKGPQSFIDLVSKIEGLIGPGGYQKAEN